MHGQDRMTINEQLADWNNFYTAVAGVAGVLVGLLFVALALSPTIMADSSPPGLRVWCSETFHGLVVMLSFALLFLIPGPDGLGIGIPVFLLSVVGLYRVQGDVRSLRSDPDPSWWRNHAGYKRFAWAIAAYLTSAVIGLGLIFGREELIDWMVAPVFLLLINSAINCWNILREVGNLPEH
jgi:hypothetical protein